MSDLLSCLHCQKIFHPKTKAVRTKFCSNTCRSRHRKNLPVDGKGRWKTCVECGEEFRAATKGPTKVCGENCRLKRKARQALSRYHGGYVPAIQEKTCPECSRKFIPSSRDPKITWCSARCKNRSNARKYKRKRRVYQKWRSKMLRQRKIGKIPSRASLLEKQGGKCNGCGISTGYIRWHVDHIIPIARGGMHTASNLQVLCSTCNYSKGDKLWVEWKRSQSA